MTHAANILKWIKTVDLEDRSKLRELAAALEQWLDTYVPDWRGRIPEHCYKPQPAGYPLAYIFFSRDALKAMRPKGWRFDIYNSFDEERRHAFSYCIAETLYKEHNHSSGSLAKEEPAELCAILEAIVYDQAQQQAAP